MMACFVVDECQNQLIHTLNTLVFSIRNFGFPKTVFGKRQSFSLREKKAKRKENVSKQENEIDEKTERGEMRERRD